MSSRLSSRRTTIPLALVATLWPLTPTAAQQRLFPNVRSFELPQASPRVHGVVGRVLSVHRGESRFGQESEAEVGLGENFPILALRDGPRPITLGFGTQVYGRFSLDDSRSALISNDWVVGLNATAQLDAWDLTLELHHESSHLGDEYEDRFGAERVDWTREVLAAWASYAAGPWRATGSLSYVLIDELGLDRPGAALGLDYRGRGSPFLGGTLRPVAGVFAEGDAATDWRISTSLRLGIALGGADRGREVSLSFIAHDGLSTQRQFFRSESRYVGAELRFDL